MYCRNSTENTDCRYSSESTDRITIGTVDIAQKVLIDELYVL
jgi:hypothetical protein